jgi:hypothetical protein
MARLGNEPKPQIYKGQKIAKEDIVWEFGKPDPNPYDVEWQLLLDAIRQDTPHNEARRAGEAEIAALMGRTAVHTGQFVTWDEMKDSKFQFVDDIDNMTFETEAPLHDTDGIYAPPQPGITVEI